MCSSDLRLNTQVVGYGAQKKSEHIDKKDLLRYVSPQDLKSYGLIPEIIGRLPVMTYLHPLDKDALLNILTQPKNALVKQYERLFELEGVKLKIDNDVLDFIADTALEYNLGARGLRSICEAITTIRIYIWRNLNAIIIGHQYFSTIIEFFRIFFSPPIV